MSIIFVCFATTNLKYARDQLVADAQGLGVFSKIEVWDEERLAAQPEYQSLPDRLKSGRGHGFFWWKPFIIRKAVDESKLGDLVFYSDCGRYDGGFRLGAGAKYLIERFHQTGFTGVEVPQFGPAKLWTRVECFSGSGCDILKFGDLPQVQATFTLWKNTPINNRALAEWESACRNPIWVADPVGDELINQLLCFKEHRHDQSLLTLITRKHSLTYIKLAGQFQSLLLPLFKRTHVGNVSFKKTQFVALCVNSGFLVIHLALSYFKSKTVSQRLK